MQKFFEFLAELIEQVIWQQSNGPYDDALLLMVTSLSPRIVESIFNPVWLHCRCLEEIGTELGHRVEPGELVIYATMKSSGVSARASTTQGRRFVVASVENGKAAMTISPG